MSETELTQDEYTVLLIASSGEYMMPIGRWEAPVEALVQRGLLHRHDKFNNTITEAGKKIVAAREQQDDKALAEGFTKLARMQLGSMQESKLEVAARTLFEFSRDCEKLSNESRELVLRRASEEVLKRALEFL